MGVKSPICTVTWILRVTIDMSSWSGFLKPLVFLLCLAPALWLSWLVLTNGLGTNPIERLTHFSGEWALRMVLIGLAITPVRRLTGWQGIARVRRMLGLFACFYATLHLSVYIVFDHFFDLAAIWRDVVKHPYILLGMSAYLLLLPLALTSTNGMMRRLGKRWKPLHRLVYLVAILGVLHFIWLVKADLREPLWYAGVLSCLLLIRVWWRRPVSG